MPLSSRCAILGRMKILASVVALVLVGLTGGWLWMDATAQARQDTEGVVITGAVDPQTATGVVGGADAGATVGPDRQVLLDQVVTLLGSASDELVTRADQEREAADRAEKKAAEKKAAEERKAAQRKAEEERKAAEKAAEEAAEEERRAAEEAAEEQQWAEPIPVQPAPVSPGGSCEWDDDEWDCDDDGDDGDDDWDDR